MSLYKDVSGNCSIKIMVLQCLFVSDSVVFDDTVIFFIIERSRTHRLSRKRRIDLSIIIIIAFKWVLSFHGRMFVLLHLTTAKKQEAYCVPFD
jgi:hypothetical protein